MRVDRELRFGVGTHVDEIAVPADDGCIGKGAAQVGASTRFKSLEVRFSGVVFPGETITTDMWQIEPGKVVLTAKTERGEAVLSNAAAEVVP